MPIEERPATVSSPPQLLTPRPPEDQAAEEAEMLMGWLTHLRASSVRKVAGLSSDALRWKPAPSANSLGGIVQHLGYSERWWFRIVFAGENLPVGFKEDGMRSTFELSQDVTSESLRVFYEEECLLADAAIRGADLSDWSRGNLGRRATLRWILTHMVEETARHAGHLDITRELIDGERGR